MFSDRALANISLVAALASMGCAIYYAIAKDSAAMVLIWLAIATLNYEQVYGPLRKGTQ